MRLSVLVLFLLTVFAEPGYTQLSYVVGVPDGFATLNGGVKGGEGGKIVTVKTGEELKTYLDTNGPFILLVDGTLTIEGELSCRGDKTVVGLGNNACIRGGGLAWNTKKNVILQNLIFEGSGDDMVKINNKCENFWIDHCTIRDSETGMLTGVDGGLDITRASKNITVSYCHFYNHNKNMLIGHSDSNAEDTVITVTIHHCFFDGTIQRNPRVRFATVHCYNNYYRNNTTYGVASATDAKVLVENCYFLNVSSPSIVGVPGFSPAGYLVEKGSVFEKCGTPQTKNHPMDFSAIYSYTLDSAVNVPEMVMKNAGCGKLSSSVGWDAMNHDTKNSLRIINGNLVFQSEKTMQAKLTIHDLQGRSIAVPFEGRISGGIEQQVPIGNSMLSKGFYHAILQTGGEITKISVIIN